MKISLALAGAALLAGSLTACGGDSGGSGGEGGDYCKDVKKAAKSFNDNSAISGAKLEEAFTTIHTLAAEAPGDVKDDWKKLDSAITSVEKGFEEAGLKLSDLSELQSGKTPEGVDVSKLQNVAKDFQKLTSPEYTKAQQNIEKHAKSTCKTSLRLS